MPLNIRSFVKMAALAVPVLIAGTAPAATLTLVFDRFAFDAAVPANVTETFNSFTLDQSFNGVSFDVGPFTLSAVPTLPSRNRIDAPVFETNVTGIDGTSNASFYLSNSQAAMIFDSPVTAFGFDHNAFGNTTNGTTTVSVLGQSILEATAGSPVVDGFVGVLSDTPFTTVMFTSTSPNDGFQIDNVSFGNQLSAVPLPAAMPLILTALGFLVWRVRKPSQTRK